MSEAVRIPLYARGVGIVGYALVDADDYPLLADREWFVSRDGYARSGRSYRMHRVILGLESGDRRQVDHINRDRLDNRRSNLRIVTQAQNTQNKSSQPGSSSRFRGVTWQSDCRKWKAQVHIGDTVHYLGLFADERDAAATASAFRRQHFTHSVEGMAA